MADTIRRRAALAAAVAVTLAACASPVPPAIRTAPPHGPAVAQVRADPAAFRGARVRWGGTVARVENRRRSTWVQVVSRPLGADGRPQRSGASAGRFIARVKGFLDPEIARRGRRVTVVGTVDGTVVQPIGSFPYRFPVVRVRTYYLWPRTPKVRRACPPPGYYVPGWYPWGPWGGWAYP